MSDETRVVRTHTTGGATLWRCRIVKAQTPTYAIPTRRQRRRAARTGESLEQCQWWRAVVEYHDEDWSHDGWYERSTWQDNLPRAKRTYDLALRSAHDFLDEKEHGGGELVTHARDPWRVAMDELDALDPHDSTRP